MSRLSMTFEDGQACYGTLDSERISAQEMDERRQQNIAYEYLCHLEEARVWIEACVNEKLPSTTELEEGLRNGVYLAKLAHFFSPEAVPLKRIYDKDQTRFQARGLHFRHTDNINAWFKAMERISFPKIFYPETTDVYDRKNMPRVVYCIHALSLFLFKLGLAPQIQDLYGKVVFTEEEISAMRRELEKYGIQMPAFSKIGGILANEMPVDEAALHAAIIAINDAIHKRISEETVRALQNPAAHLINICYDHPEEYQNMLLMVKEHKAENSRNKSIDLATYEPDVYDELLTQAEIQGNINKVNAIIVLDNINAALDKEDHSVLLQMLASPYLGLRDVREENVLWYSQQLLQERENKKQNNNENELLPLDKDEVQNAISQANEQANMARLRINAVTTINIAIESRNEEKMIASLISPSAQLPPVFDFASSLYQEEFTNIRNEKQTDLSYDEILGGVKILSSIALINMAVESGDVVETFNLLSHKNSHITGLDEQNMQKYLDHLSSAKHSKQGTSCEFLLHREVQDCVNEANQKALDEHERVRAIGKINEAIKTGDHLQILDALQQPSAGLKYVESKQSAHYQVLLLEAKRSKAKLLEDGEEDAELWLEEIQEAITQANRHAMEAAKLGAAMSAINQAIDEKEPTQLLQALSNTDAALYSVTPDCASNYQIQLQMAKEAKMEKGESGSEWVEYKSREGYAYYYNAHSMEYSWEIPDGFKGNNHILTREEVQSVVSKVTAAYDRELFYKANEPYIIKIQAVIRGFIVRSAFRELQAYWQEQVPAVTKIQAWFRGMRQRKRYQDRLKVLQANESSVIKLQSKLRMLKAKKAYRKRLQVFKDNEDSVVKIQAYFRSNRARQDYKVLVNADDPPVGVVRKFVHLLDLSDLDFSEELELQKLRGQVVQDIRHNQQLEQDLNMMDIKIGLLVKNRITLQDVVAHGRKLKHHREISSAQASHKGLKALSKERRDKLEAYQHLFYLLQTQPTYLARLIFEMPQSKTTKFMESVILSLYNYAANAREEYLLLKLMKTALEEEIKSKVDKMSDIVSGNPLVIKMIVSFNRNGRGQSSLKDLLNPLVTQVIEDKTLLINTNPIEVYKAWVNQEESKTGQALGLPYDVTVEQALSHEEVSNRIEKSVKNLTTASTNFLKTILQSMDMIPYGMRYMAKVLKNALHDKFPDEPEKDILKIVGNLLYYRYINSAIVAPDAFDIIDLSRDKSLTNEQRRNLGSIAKILQFAASNKGFGGDSAHLSSMNSYIKDCHEKFKKYFKLCCEVEEPEFYFNIDQYTEATMLTKPVIYISIQEICDTHQLLMDHQDAIAPDHNDDLHELLEDLGESPSVEALIGEDLDETTKIQLAKTEISLTLNNKFKMLENDLSDMHGLFIRTKLLIINLIRCCHHGEHLTTILDSAVTDEEEDEHFCLIKRMDQLDRKAESRNAQLTRSQSLINDSRLPLAQMKEKIKHNLKRLDETKLVSQENKYQEIINAIVKDIRNQRRYRQQRKQELNRLRNTVKCLDDKTKFYEEQIDYYNQYVKVCIDNLATKRKKTNRSLNPFQQKAETKTKGSIKYSAARLHKEGIVLEIEGLPTNQFKNVLFDLATTDDPGVFDISAKFMGVNMEKVELVFQDLLQLQYEGVAVMNLFGKAKVNVNLLIFLINKKFYGK